MKFEKNDGDSDLYLSNIENIFKKPKGFRNNKVEEEQIISNGETTNAQVSKEELNYNHVFDNALNTNYND
ncbi:hypothetical protein PIROE2DRAFT_2202 [Piromyces sp. E2]|nr:hypothetical protein PIROE2DRAFT_2202 [Piromyces sp. E2]|eukprot:OUM69778.1 hypothetical protein PIROE2DRAFT_2202 [Piromyces sp. E2]